MLVAGGARGIGRAIAWRIAEEGGMVCVIDIRVQDLDNLKSQGIQSGLSIDTTVCDLSVESAVITAIEEVLGRQGRLDVVVNCVGIVGATGINIDSYDTSIFQRVLEVNLTAAFLLTKYAIPPMLKRSYGRILHITSIGGKEGNPGMVGYAASKSGMIGLVKAVGKEYAGTGITVNGLAPAVIATEFNETTAKETIDYMTSKIPMGRMGTTDEVASIACWIVSEEASFNTGFVFDLSGGRATY